MHIKKNKSDKAKFPSTLINKTINGLTAKNFYHTHFDIGNKVDLSLPSGLNGEAGNDIDIRGDNPEINFYIMYPEVIKPYPEKNKKD